MFSLTDRRIWLKSAAGVSLTTAFPSLLDAQYPEATTRRAQNIIEFAERKRPAASDCPDCGGVGFLPLKNRRPYFHVEGQGAPRAAEAAPHRFCPKCRSDGNEQELVEEQVRRLKIARAGHERWERETKFQLTRVETRHIVVHTQMSLAECVKIGLSFENLAGHLQKLTGTMELTLTRPESYEQMCLLGPESYEHFRSVMENLYTPEERGPRWSVSRGLTAFDHSLIAFFQETPQSLRRRPPVNGVCFMGGRKQLSVATNNRAPRWLSEGFAEYCEFVALKRNLWRTVYNQNEGPKPGDWILQIRQLAADGQLRPWPEQMVRDLEIWDARDYLQVFGMAAFLLQTEPHKFLVYTRKMRAGIDPTTALEEAFEKPIAKLEPECCRWLVGGGK